MMNKRACVAEPLILSSGVRLPCEVYKAEQVSVSIWAFPRRIGHRLTTRSFYCLSTNLPEIKAVSLGYATQRSFARSQSEASIFRPVVNPPLVENPSDTLWKSGYTQLSRVKSTSSAISGLNDDAFRAGWRRNEPGPYWEQDHELEPDRQLIIEDRLMTKIEEAEGDGFPLEEEDELDASGPESAQHDLDDSSSQAEDQLGDLPTPDLFRSPLLTPRKLSKTQSMPVSGQFALRPNQVRQVRRPYDPNFMCMDASF